MLEYSDCWYHGDCMCSYTVCFQTLRIYRNNCFSILFVFKQLVKCVRFSGILKCGGAVDALKLVCTVHFGIANNLIIICRCPNKYNHYSICKYVTIAVLINIQYL